MKRCLFHGWIELPEYEKRGWTGVIKYFKCNKCGRFMEKMWAVDCRSRKVNNSIKELQEWRRF